MAEQRVVLVTGGARGIGKAIAAWLVVRRSAVVILDCAEEQGRATEKELSEGGEILFVPTDVADESQVQAAVAMTIDRFGALHGLVNNAGVGGPFGTPIDELPLAEWNRVLSTNLTGSFLCTKHAARWLRKSHGSIVNIASTRAFQSEAHTEAYSASKGAIVALTHSLAVSLGPAVRVNCVAPGWIDVHESELSREDHEQHPVGRVGKPGDVAPLVGYLLSDEAGFVTGQTFVADGGMTRKMIYTE
jgi:NAD(P)-dependent dehydrogenase (short-subunit alcohol dehydrogenase family)